MYEKIVIEGEYGIPDFVIFFLEDVASKMEYAIVDTLNRVVTLEVDGQLKRYDFLMIQSDFRRAVSSV